MNTQLEIRQAAQKLALQLVESKADTLQSDAAVLKAAQEAGLTGEDYRTFKDDVRNLRRDFAALGRTPSAKAKAAEAAKAAPKPTPKTPGA